MQPTRNSTLGHLEVDLGLIWIRHTLHDSSATSFPSPLLETSIRRATHSPNPPFQKRPAYLQSMKAVRSVYSTSSGVPSILCPLYIANHYEGRIYHTTVLMKSDRNTNKIRSKPHFFVCCNMSASALILSSIVYSAIQFSSISSEDIAENMF